MSWIWIEISAIAGVLGVLVSIAAIILFQRSRESRLLAYRSSVTPELLSVSREIEEEVEIRYRGREVTELEGATVAIINEGNKGIEMPKPSEYEQPVTIDFGEGAEIIGSPRITESVPKDLQASVRVEDGKVVLEPVLLNPGQSISVFTLLSGSKGRVRVRAHIKDVELQWAPSLEVETSYRSGRLRQLLVLLLAYPLAIIMFIIMGISEEGFAVDLIIAAIATIVWVVSLASTVFSPRKLRVAHN